MPAARAATLSVYDDNGRAFDNPAGRTFFSNEELTRSEEGVFSVILSADPQPGNWLPVAADARMVVVLRLYDTPLGANAAALTSESVPALERLSCR